MIELRENTLAAIAKAAERCDPHEMCGVIVEGGDFIEIPNTATDFDTFVMDRRAYAKVSSAHKIVAIVHSHVYLPAIASEADRAMCEKLGIPWVIFSWPTGNYSIIEPCGWMAPLVGREWGWGTQDCWGLVRDAYKSLAGIDLKDFPRDWLWWKNGENLIPKYYPEAGFRLVDGPPKHLDFLVMQIQSPVPNHCAVFLEPDVVLHHLMGRKSVREVYGGFYQRATVLHLRHEAFA
jgi:proteasome lid subunit RPN8/RPN11